MLKPILETAHRFDGVDLRELARRVETPFYAYSATRIRRQVDDLRDALHGLDTAICYAVKANPNLAVLSLMAEAGVGADIVSAGELRRALRAGIPGERIVFSGVGKTEAEIGEALAADVWKFNVESFDELQAIERVACSRNAVAKAAVRVNPDVDAGTHEKISTGKAENKFGVSIAEARSWFARANEFPHVRLDGLHAHIGSQILSIAPFRAALERVAGLWIELVANGHPIESIDVGGGLGVAYRESDPTVAVDDYAAAIRRGLAGFRGRIVLEPGRWLVAQAGVLVTRVIRVKRGEARDFLVVDAAMNDLQRPAMYGAWHEIVALHDEARAATQYDVVGPVCESSDTFAVQRALPACEAGDLLLMTEAGAYGASMSSTYNSRPLIAEVLLEDGCYAVVRLPQSFDEMVSGERAARDWQRL